jgi:flavin-dependent dehydrogenase
LATAIALRHQDLTVVVFERSDYRSLRVGEHIPPNTKSLLLSLGLADLLESDRHASCPSILSSWGGDEPAERHYLFDPHGLGLNLTRPDFDLSLASLAKRLGVVVRTGARLVTLSHAAGSWHVRVQHAGTESDNRFDFLVDATGRAASITKRFGARPLTYDELIGIFGRIPRNTASNNAVLIEALPQGWWYSAGLADGSIVATFLTDPELVDASKTGRIHAWDAQLNAARLTAARIAHYGRVDLHVRTARTQRLDKPVGEGWLAVGDAAMAFDPLSSEGISKGLEWGQKAASTAAAVCCGDRSALEEYRQAINKTFAEYLITRYRYYSAETRWPDEPFWRRRRLPPKSLR